MRLREGRTILLVVSAPARRQQVTYAKARGLSERRACALMSVARSALHYESILAVPDAPVLAAMSILSAQYPRYGYRRIQIFLARQGHSMSVDRAWRLWRLAGLQVPRKRPRRRVSVHRPRPLSASDRYSPHVEVDHHYYSVPHALVRQEVYARVTRRGVEILDGGKRVAAHVRSRLRNKHTTLSEHMPAAHRAQMK